MSGITHDYLETTGLKPTALELAKAELAINLVDKTLWSKDHLGLVFRLGGRIFDETILANAGIELAGGLTGPLYFESKKHTITNNDGGGNFNIRVGNTWESGAPLITEDGYAMNQVWDQSVGSVSWTCTTASQLIGETPVNQNVLTLTAAGLLTATNDVVAFSDERIKDDIKIIEGALEKISKLKGVTFTRTDMSDDTRYTGVIAQDVQKVLPEAVHTSDEGMLTVAYGNMIGLLIEGMKEQQTTIDSLNKRLEALEAK